MFFLCLSGPFFNQIFQWLVLSHHSCLYSKSFSVRRFTKSSLKKKRNFKIIHSTQWQNHWLAHCLLCIYFKICSPLHSSFCFGLFSSPVSLDYKIHFLSCSILYSIDSRTLENNLYKINSWEWIDLRWMRGTYFFLGQNLFKHC
jgi:hypothetical protein